MEVEMNQSASFKEFKKANFKGVLKYEEYDDVKIAGDGKNVIIFGKTYDFVNLLRLLDGKFKEYKLTFTDDDSTEEKMVKGWMIKASNLHIVDNNLQDIIKVSQMKKHKWLVACEKANVKFAKKGTDDYINVKKFFDNLTDDEVTEFLKKKEEEKNEMLNSILSKYH